MLSYKSTYKSILVPGDSLLLVGVGVGVALNGTGLATEKTVKVWTDLVTLTLLEGVALSTSGLEEVGTLLSVSYMFELASCTKDSKIESSGFELKGVAVKLAKSQTRHCTLANRLEMKPKAMAINAMIDNGCQLLLLSERHKAQRSWGRW